MLLRFVPALGFLLLGAVVVAAPKLCYGEATREDGADLILSHGVFYPVQPPGKVEGSLAVRGGGGGFFSAVRGGRIVYLGPDAGAERLRTPRTRVIDLRGRTVTPGLIDAHSHLAGLGQSLEEVDLTGAPTYGEVIRRVREAARSLPPGVWVQGRGWDQNRWPEKRFPTHQELSAAVPDHPVWLTRVDGHAALVNAAAMKALGIDAAIKDPSGGRFLRDEAGGPTRVLGDNAMGQAEGGRP